MKHTKPVVLVILDGFGYRKEGDFNAIFHAHTPHLTAWFARYPHTLLKASGSAVGLLDHQLSNSEVGHFTIGSGRVTLQSSARIDEAITNRSFFKNPALLEPLQRLGASGKSLHIMGLLSDAGVHSDIQQL
ncbi:MAG TPA: 2,3-bisphosphoglycerate-independent phosphoglycerate mutase, partial [Candidatus Limnocylindria bacterium]|nr:2,3-bisphosphoglycerate-independent phosphoglycerate mutase [Candidatus Limnocylindria bacterium]